MADTKIEWADKVWNPVVGCTKCSPGCSNCYAERFACRLAAMEMVRVHDGKYKYAKVVRISKGKWTGDIFCDNKALEIPLHWRKPRRIFVCSMGDLFHPKVPFVFIANVFWAISNASQHTYLILTKRSREMKEFFQLCEDWDPSEWPNVHLGVSISTPDEMWKAKVLADISATVRFISFEPLLRDVGKIPLKHIDWLVVGGESGPNARPMKTEWVRNIRDQCIAANVPFFFKQWGEWLPVTQRTKEQCEINIISFWPKRVTDFGAERFLRFGKNKTGSILDGGDWKQLPERR